MAGPDSHGRTQVHLDTGRDQVVLGALLIAIGAVVAAGRLIPDAAPWVVVGIGVVPLATFVFTRWDWAMIWGGIQTGAGTGVLLVSDQAFGGDPGLFLLALAGGFAAVSLMATAYRLRDHRLWPLVPAAIIGLIGAFQLAGAHDLLGAILDVGWPAALFAVGAFLIGRALIRSTSKGPQ